MIKEIRKILSDDNIKKMACEYTLAEEEYQGFILGCNVLADEIEEQVKKCSIPDVSQQRELFKSFLKKVVEEIEINTRSELQDYKNSKEVCHLDMRNWEDGYIDLCGANTGYINLRGATTGYINLRDANTTGSIDLCDATTGDIDLRDANTGDIDLRDATYSKIIQNYTKEDKEFLKSLPLDIIKLDTWQSNENWKNCTTKKELHTCGTTYCVRGYAEAQYYIENGKQVEDVDSLYPNLKHLFYMTNEQFLKEIEYILNS